MGELGTDCPFPVRWWEFPRERPRGERLGSCPRVELGLSPRVKRHGRLSIHQGEAEKISDHLFPKKQSDWVGRGIVGFVTELNVNFA